MLSGEIPYINNSFQNSHQNKISQTRCQGIENISLDQSIYNNQVPILNFVISDYLVGKMV